MPRYVVERTYTVDLNSLPAVGRRSKQLGRDSFPEITWEHSHVVLAEDGALKSFCIYEAPSKEVVREHSRRLGEHFVEEIYEIAGDVTPDDFPLDGESAST
ncbi:MAG: nickel-binding protein [Gaiellaceae bacterium]